MPASSLVEHANQLKSRDGRNLYWARAGVDGFPYRGEYPPDMTETEYDQRVVRVVDTCNGFFDVLVPTQNKEYLAVMEAISNGWFQGIYIERFWRGTTQHYVEWNEYYMQDGSRTPYSAYMELGGGGNGSSNGAGHSRPYQR